MRRTSSALLWLLLVFVSGTSVGIVGYRYFSPKPAREEGRPSRDQVRQEYLEKLRSRIGVNEEQIARIVAILDAARQESDARRQQYDTDMRAIQHRSRDQIRAVFSAEQLEKYEAWREERQREREKRDRERGAKTEDRGKEKAR